MNILPMSLLLFMRELQELRRDGVFVHLLTLREKTGRKSLAILISGRNDISGYDPTLDIFIDNKPVDMLVEER